MPFFSAVEVCTDLLKGSAISWKKKITNYETKGYFHSLRGTTLWLQVGKVRYPITALAAAGTSPNDLLGVKLFSGRGFSLHICIKFSCK